MFREVEGIFWQDVLFKAKHAEHSSKPSKAENTRAEALLFSMVSLPWHETAFHKTYCQKIRPRLSGRKHLKSVGEDEGNKLRGIV